ncbi:MAG TPA: hypothetical protein VFX98_02715 [Longimicrobiaceae bacterium]|nr:hypothetical protein [Longimicrobiaceae bacterium]
MEATNSPSAVTKASSAPAASPGSTSGSTTRRSAVAREAPSEAAASSSAGSSWRKLAMAARVISGMLRMKYASGRMAKVPTSTSRPASGRCTLKVVARAMASTVPGSAQGSTTSALINPRPRTRRRAMWYPAAKAKATFARVATVAIRSELSTGTSRSGSAKRRR